MWGDRGVFRNYLYFLLNFNCCAPLPHHPINKVYLKNKKEENLNIFFNFFNPRNCGEGVAKPNQTLGNNLVSSSI